MEFRGQKNKLVSREEMLKARRVLNDLSLARIPSFLDKVKDALWLFCSVRMVTSRLPFSIYIKCTSEYPRF